MRKLLFTFVFSAFFIALYGQQGVQYTSFMFNKLGFNPAYAGSHDCPCLSGIHRSQWIAFEGAPTSQTVNFHMPMFAKRVGMGLSLQHDQIGPTDSYWASLGYAYRIPFKKGKLSVGLQASMRSYSVDLTDARTIQGNDNAVMNGTANKVLPNFGAGLYWLSEKFYAGVSLPYIVGNDLGVLKQLASNSDFGREERHWYAMAGFKVNASKKLAIKPAAMFKYVEDAPADLDLHTSLIFYETFGIGATYRLGGFDFSGGDSFDIIAHLNLGKFTIGGAYDVSLSDVREYSSGTFEVFLEYCMKNNDDKLTNPRFFF